MSRNIFTVRPYHQRAWHQRHHCFHTCTNRTWTTWTSPTNTNIWSTLGAFGDVSVNVKIRVYDAIGAASIVSTPSLLIGDNIMAKKWAFIDTVTPGNKHIHIAYHWVKEHVWDQDIDLRDTPLAANLADFLTKNQTRPQIWASTNAASGYASPPAILAST